MGFVPKAAVFKCTAKKIFFYIRKGGKLNGSIVTISLHHSSVQKYLAENPTKPEIWPPNPKFPIIGYIDEHYTCPTDMVAAQKVSKPIIPDPTYHQEVGFDMAKVSADEQVTIPVKIDVGIDSTKAQPTKPDYNLTPASDPSVQSSMTKAGLLSSEAGSTPKGLIIRFIHACGKDGAPGPSIINMLSVAHGLMPSAVKNHLDELKASGVVSSNHGPWGNWILIDKLDDTLASSALPPAFLAGTDLFILPKEDLLSQIEAWCSELQSMHADENSRTLALLETNYPGWMTALGIKIQKKKAGNKKKYWIDPKNLADSYDFEILYSKHKWPDLSPAEQVLRFLLLSGPDGVVVADLAADLSIQPAVVETVLLHLVKVGSAIESVVEGKETRYFIKSGLGISYAPDDPTDLVEGYAKEGKFSVLLKPGSKAPSPWGDILPYLKHMLPFSLEHASAIVAFIHDRATQNRTVSYGELWALADKSDLHNVVSFVQVCKDHGILRETSSGYITMSLVGAIQKKELAKKKNVLDVQVPIGPEDHTVPDFMRMPDSVPRVGDLEPSSATFQGKEGYQKVYSHKGQLWIWKEAIKKHNGTPKPFSAYACQAFSNIARLVKPNHVLVQVAELDGKVGSLQPLIEQLKQVRGRGLQALPWSVRFDIASEQILDWGMSQHDSHHGQFLIAKDGHAYAIDKEQAWYNLNKGSPETTGEQLSKDYHCQINGSPVIYNIFCNEWVGGLLKFDPFCLRDVVDAWDKISDDTFRGHLHPYTKSFFNSEEAGIAFEERALARKRSVRKDFEEFFTNLYRLKIGSNVGTFNFENGFGSHSSARRGRLAAKIASGFKPPETTVDQKNEAIQIFDTKILKLIHFQESDSADVESGDLRLLPSKMARSVIELIRAGTPLYGKFWDRFVSEDAYSKQDVLTLLTLATERLSSAAVDELSIDLVEVLLPTDPFGQAILAAEIRNRRNGVRGLIEKNLNELISNKLGKTGTFSVITGWTQVGTKGSTSTKKKKVKVTAAQYAGQIGIRVKPYSKNGSIDSSKYALKISISSPAHILTDFADKFGLKSVSGISSGSNNLVMTVSSDELNSASVTEEVDSTEPVDTPSADPHTGTWQYLPQLNIHRRAKQGMDDLCNIASFKDLGRLGRNYVVGGADVEFQNLTVRRMKGPSGVYYNCHLRLRSSLTKEILKNAGPSSKDGTWQYFPGSYNSDIDAVCHAGQPEVETSSRVWSTDGGFLFLSKGHSSRYNVIHSRAEGDQWALYGSINTVITSSKVIDTFKVLLDMVQPGLAASVFHDPDATETETLKLALLLWDADPKTSLQLKAKDFTVENLLKKVKAAGVKDSDIAMATRVDSGVGHTTFAIPDRWRTLGRGEGQPQVRFLMFGCSTPMKIVEQLRTGLLSIHARLLGGTGHLETSSSGHADLLTGGADSAMMRLITTDTNGPLSNWVGNVSGSYRFIVAPDVLDRLDCYMYLSDTYGALNTNRGGVAERLSMHDAISNHIGKGYQVSAEVCARHGISCKSYLGISCDSVGKRDMLLSMLRTNGITEINNVPIESFVFVGGNVQDIHAKLVLGSGY